MQRILVTGGAGFIGSHTVDLLLANQMEVIVFDNLASGRLAYLNLSHPRLTFIEGDILHFSELLAAMESCDAVLHLAALPSVPKSIEDPIASLQVNTAGFLHVLQTIRLLKKPIRLVYASSAAVYGNSTDLPCDDSKPLTTDALSPYALEKANNERYADLFQRLMGLNAIGLRYFNVYGPRQDPASPYSGVISRFIEHYQHDQAISIFGDGRQSRDFIHVNDVARANWLALQSTYCGMANVATGKAETLVDLIRYIEAHGKKAKVNFAAPRVGDIRESYAKTEKAAHYLKFQAEIRLQEGIQSLLKIEYHNGLK